MPLTKVLHILPDLEIGGTQGAVLDMVSHLDRDQFLPYVCCLSEGGALSGKLRERGIPFHTCYFNGNFSLFGLNRLRNLIREIGAHIVHTHTPRANQAGRLAAVWARTPVICCHYYHTEVNSPPQAKWLTRWLARRTEQIFCANNPVREARLGTGLESAEKLSVFHSFIEPSDYRDDAAPAVVKAELGFPADVPVVGIVGRLHLAKNHELFLQVAKQLFAEDPGIHFAIIGDGELRQSLSTRVSELGIASCVTFTGNRSDMARTYRALNAVVVCSESNGGTKVILEAQAAEVPVVALNAGGIAEIMAGGGGYLVSEATTQAFAQAVDYALQPENFAPLIEQARKNVAHFSASRRATMLEDIYNEWVEKKYAFQHIY